MFRTDGKYKVYQIQHRFKKQGDWSVSGDHLFANVPTNLRVENGTFIPVFPFNLFASTGDVWRFLGIHGTFDVKAGKKMLTLVAEYNPQHSFRLVLMRISQTTKEIASANITD